MSGWVSLHRKLVEWEWYTDQNAKAVFIHCLLKANFKDKEWKGMVIKRGSFVTSRSKLAVELGLSEQKVRLALTKLSKKEISVKTTNKFTIVTVVNYDDYQDKDKEEKPTKNHQKTIKKPSKNHQKTTTNNDNKENKGNNDNKTTKQSKIAEEIKNLNLLPELEKALIDFATMRKDIKKPLTKVAVTRLIKKLNSLSADINYQIAVLDQSIVNGWQGVFELKDNSYTQQSDGFTDTLQQIYADEERREYEQKGNGQDYSGY